MNPNDAIYESSYIQGLFDEMSKTYGWVNYVSSFGFTKRWREACIEYGNLSKHSKICDMMTGMGELLPGICNKAGKDVEIIAIDLSPVMCTQAREQKKRLEAEIAIVETNVFANTYENESFDTVLSSFGLKTFTMSDQVRLAKEVDRLLKPGGHYAFVEVAIPPFFPLRLLFTFYLKYIVPLLGALFLGNPDNYKMLYRYTKTHRDSRVFFKALTDCGLAPKYDDLFFGCASLVSGRKQKSSIKATEFDSKGMQ